MSLGDISATMLEQWTRLEEANQLKNDKINKLIKTIEERDAEIEVLKHIVETRDLTIKSLSNLVNVLDSQTTDR